MCLVVRVSYGGLIRVGAQVREGKLALVGRVLIRLDRYPIRVGKDEDRPVVFHDMVVLIPTKGTYSTQHNFHHLVIRTR